MRWVARHRDTGRIFGMFPSLKEVQAWVEQWPDRTRFEVVQVEQSRPVEGANE